MTRRLKPLTDREVQAARPGSNLRDGGGLFLRVSAKGSKTWTFRFTAPAGAMAGKAREMGLGSYPTVSLAGARAAATEARLLVQRGKDPIEERAAQRQAAAAQAEARSTAPTLGEYAERVFLPDVLKTFRNAAHRQQWQATFRTHFAALRDRRLAEISRRDVLEVLRPLWATKYRREPT